VRDIDDDEHGEDFAAPYAKRGIRDLAERKNSTGNETCQEDWSVCLSRVKGYDTQEH
jgi:hypothetical protein